MYYRALRGLRAAGVGQGVLAVLVPEGRVRTVADVVAADLESLGVPEQGPPWRVPGSPAVTVTAITWDDVLNAMLAARGSAAGDIEQLLGACRAMRGIDVDALSATDLAGGWRDREDDVRLIIDRVTREAIAELALPLAPWLPKPSGGLKGGFRYLAPADLPNLAVGMRSDEVNPPLWVRWHRQTADLGRVEHRLAEAGRTAEHHDGHLWFALVCPPAAGSAAGQIEGLARQVVDLYRIAVGAKDA